uniref:NT-3 growth factor receptor n=1 Tax=Sphaerodactylus townsendi TaxID=933632 RepID=A0ACB8G6V4_9SAUR
MLCPTKGGFWNVFFLWSLWGDYLGTAWGCPANCVCNKTEIGCTKPDDGTFFPLLEGQDSGPPNGNASINITDISRSIMSITLELQEDRNGYSPHLNRDDSKGDKVTCFPVDQTSRGHLEPGFYSP